MKFPSISLTLGLLRPLKHSKKISASKNASEKTLYDHIEEIITIPHSEQNKTYILKKFYELSELHQQLMIVALIEHKTTETLQLVLESNYNVNFLIKGHTPLHFAIQNENQSMVQMLIKNNADLELKDNYKESPLNFAIRTENIEIIKYLIEIGADVNSEASDCITPLARAIQMGNIQIVSILGKYGATLGSTHVIKQLNFYNDKKIAV